MSYWMGVLIQMIQNDYNTIARRVLACSLSNFSQEIPLIILRYVYLLPKLIQMVKHLQTSVNAKGMQFRWDTVYRWALEWGRVIFLAEFKRRGALNLDDMAKSRCSNENIDNEEVVTFQISIYRYSFWCYTDVVPLSGWVIQLSTARELFWVTLRPVVGKRVALSICRLCSTTMSHHSKH